MEQAPRHFLALRTQDGMRPQLQSQREGVGKARQSKPHGRHGSDAAAPAEPPSRRPPLPPIGSWPPFSSSGLGPCGPAGL